MHHPVRGSIRIMDARLAWTAYIPNTFHKEDSQLSWPLVSALQNDLQAMVFSIDLLLTESSTRWFNSIRDILYNSKAHDLFVAHKEGFAIPSTIVAGYINESEAVLDGKEWVYKTLFSQTIDFDAYTWMAAYTQAADKNIRGWHS